jgi:hypothetical protein
MKPLYTAVIAIVVGAAGFFGGMQYQKMQTTGQFESEMNSRFQNGTGQFSRTGSQGSRMIGGGRVVGSVLNMDESSMTVKSPDGSSKIVVLSEKTTYNKASEGSLSDLKEGDSVSVFGTTNSDGSITAQNVQIGELPMMRNGGTPPNGSPSGSPTQ